MMRTKRVMVLMAISLCVCGLAIVVWRALYKQASTAGTPVRDLAVEGRAHFAKFAVQPLSAMNDESMARLMMQGSIDAAEAAAKKPGDADGKPSVASGKHSDAELRGVVAATAEFVRMRFLQESPAAYREWRKRKGYVQRSKEILKGSGVAVNWGFWTNRPGQEPSFVDLAELMDGSFAASLDALGGRARPVKIATDAEAFAINFYQEDRRHPAPTLEGKMGADLWLGNIAASPMSLWEPPRSRKALLSKPGWMRCADVGVILEGATGDRFPWVFTWIQDPVDQQWYLSWVIIQNFDGNLPMIVY